MQKEFLTTMKKRSHRQRFYSSMTYEQYCDVYDEPPAPLCRPQQSPDEDIPLLDLEAPAETEATHNQREQELAPVPKMDTIYQIDGSENFTQNLQKSPRNDFFSSGRKSRETLGAVEEVEAPKRMRVRMRSQSDNSEYLIFNFLERISEKGRKKVKLQ